MSTQLKRTLSESLGLLEQFRNHKKARVESAAEAGWEPVCIDDFDYEYQDVPKELCFPVLEYLPGRGSLVDLFLTFIDQSLVENVLDDLPMNTWVINKVRNQYFQPSVSQIYIMLAVYIRIQGRQNSESEDKKSKRPMDEAVQEAIDHFIQQFPLKKSPGITRLQIMLSRFLITNRYYERLNANFQSLVKQLGQYVAGDEKLLHFIGNTTNVRIVPSKPDRAGLWFYQLTAPLKCGIPYLLYGRLHEALSTLDETIPTEEVVREWVDVVQRVNGDPNSVNPDCILNMDSYHLSNNSRKELSDRKVKYVASATKERFPDLVDMVKVNVNRPGDWSGVYKPGDVPELFVYNWDANKDAGKMFCLTNAFQKVSKAGGCPKTVIPGYDAYKCMSSVCERFNRNLHDRAWPHKRGGHGVNGDFGHQHNLFMSCCLQNTFAAYVEIEQMESAAVDYKDLAIQLADDLYERFAAISS